MKSILSFLYSATCILLVSLSLLHLQACKKDDTPTSGTPSNDPPVNGSGCFPIQALSPQIAPLYQWEYYPENPQLLRYYREFDSESGAVERTYEFLYTYNSELSAYLLDTMVTYIGNVVGAQDFLEKVVYQYEFIDAVNYTITGAEVFRYNEGEPSLMLIKGNLYFDYNSSGLISEITYSDFIDNSMGTLIDNYRYVFEYDDEERIIVSRFFDYTDEETTTEYFTPSPYFKAPTFELTMHPQLRWGYRYAHQSQVIQFGSSQFTYNYVYQANSDNYVIERSSINSFNGDTLLLSIITYTCYD